MIRQNPRQARGGKIRTNLTGMPDISKISDSLTTGFRFYRSYGYNAGLPVFNRLSVKHGSASKSLRYRFLSDTGIKPVASLSLHDFIFPVSGNKDLEKLNRIISTRRTPDFLASFSHISDISAIMPEDKQLMSSDFFAVIPDMRHEEPVFIDFFHGPDDAEQLTWFLKNETGAKSAEIIDIGGFKTIRASIPDIKSKADRLLTHSMVKSLSPRTVLSLTPDYIRHEDLPLDCVDIRDFSKRYPRAAVVDSGVCGTSYLKEWEISTVRLTGSEDANPRHGTFVSGRLLLNGERFGGITYLNVEMLPADGCLPIDVFYSRMKTLLKEYHKYIKIYNISMGSSAPVDVSGFSHAAHMLDSLQKEFDVLFIISAGNYEPLRLDSSDRLLDNTVTVPAESIHSLTVGSASHTDTNLQLKDSPSLFSRRGSGAGGAVKPEICAYGGAHETRMGRVRPVGVFSIGIRNELAEDTGTSHAVPRVSALAAKLYEKYSHAYESPDMTKALILHYTHLKTGKEPDIYTGYGVVPDDHSMFEHRPDSAVYLHSGTVQLNSIVEIPDIPVPSLLFSGQLATGTLCVTLVYKTDTDMNFPHFYQCVNLEASVGYYKNSSWTSVLTAKDLLTYPKNCLSDDDVKERLKWHPVKLYEKKFKNSRIPDDLIMRIVPFKRDFYKGKAAVKYSAVISFSHSGKNVFEFLQKNYRDYENKLEPASLLWKTC